jgi:hypothetical protein
VVTESADESAWVECGVTEADLAGMRAIDPGVGRMVETICHDDRASAIDALFHLKNEICHQGMAIGVATPFVLPLLITLLSCSALPVRVELFRLVRQVAQVSTAWRRAAGDAGGLYAENYRERVKWEVAVDRIFAESRSQFEVLRHDPDAAIRQIADEVIARI